MKITPAVRRPSRRRRGDGEDAELHVGYHDIVFVELEMAPCCSPAAPLKMETMPGCTLATLPKMEMTPDNKPAVVTSSLRRWRWRRAARRPPRRRRHQDEDHAGLHAGCPAAVVTGVKKMPCYTLAG
ncbi:hypothetical protein ACUV84_041551 [Puccinellia chinampoensis]